MGDETRSSRLPSTLIVLALVGGGFYFLSRYQVTGLDAISVRPRANVQDADHNDDGYGNPLGDSTMFVGITREPGLDSFDNPFDAPLIRNDAVLADLAPSAADELVTSRIRRIRNLRIGSWALNGFGPSKLNNDLARRNIVRIAHQFDVLALQEISTPERDIIPRLVDTLNEGGRSYEYVLGETTGPHGYPEQLAILFDTETVRVDRTQVYSVADPGGNMTYAPLVAWFRAARPKPQNAWTFSIVNVHINLQRAGAEVALMPGLFQSVRSDGRGEDDVVMLGLLQADDRYMIPQIMGDNMVASVRSVPTDIFGRHQTGNVLIDPVPTSEYLGRGGALDFLRNYNLSISEAETVSSQLPVFAEFSAIEGGEL
ncbi:exonuclease/endonuclease/phosphatase family protein [Stieleria varia]|uniref:Endonuclease/Exonuclease/phosphatase family protein n=1 Tax=Stieleria varia TaxID=2528005 RepID=A0A5C6B2J6_9BACT|nr:deoxyribonuclease I [Stieleria varia]TWU04634.1 hypothetical protein Pla52n_26760 [Stieleria varia]